ncbi:TPA: glycoside hydrolase family 19 protein, partial [Mannheimia haemolytica]|nr:glycoside hydrolase family 19 protein [Mannheimia haemolytica]
AMFLAQCGVECAGYSVFEENLNYSATALLRTFPKYFAQYNVVLYARNKQAIANRVYANRMGNGNERSGDGWKYRGRGLIQITGKANYIDFAKW